MSDIRDAARGPHAGDVACVHCHAGRRARPEEMTMKSQRWRYLAAIVGDGRSPPSPSPCCCMNIAPAEAGGAADALRAGEAHRGHGRPRRCGARTSRASTTATSAPWTPSARATAAARPSPGSTPTRACGASSPATPSRSTTARSAATPTRSRDQDETERVQQAAAARRLPAVPRLDHPRLPQGAAAATSMKGFEMVSAMPCAEARKLVDAPDRLHRLPRPGDHGAARHAARASCVGIKRAT